MKRFLIMAALLLTFSVGYAQDALRETDPPVYENAFLTFAGFAAGVVLLVEAIKRLFPSLNGIATQLVSWLTGIVLALFGWVFNLGIFDGMLWYIALLYGLGASFAANGVADTGLIQWILGLFKTSK